MILDLKKLGCADDENFVSMVLHHTQLPDFAQNTTFQWFWSTFSNWTPVCDTVVHLHDAAHPKLEAYIPILMEYNRIDMMATTFRGSNGDFLSDSNVDFGGGLPCTNTGWYWNQSKSESAKSQRLIFFFVFILFIWCKWIMLSTF